MAADPVDAAGDPLVCRSCEEVAPTKDLIRPCLCRGSVKYVHRGCLDQWRARSPNAQSFGQCDVCHYPYRLEPQVSAARRLWARMQFLLLCARDFLLVFLVVNAVVIGLGFLGELTGWARVLAEDVPTVVDLPGFNVLFVRVYSFGGCALFFLLGLVGLALSVYRCMGCAGDSHWADELACCSATPAASHTDYRYSSPFWDQWCCFFFVWNCSPGPYNSGYAAGGSPDLCCMPLCDSLCSIASCCADPHPHGYHHHGYRNGTGTTCTDCGNCCAGCGNCGSCGSCNGCGDCKCHGGGGSGDCKDGGGIIAVLLIILLVIVIIIIIIGFFFGIFLATLLVGMIINRHVQVLKRYEQAALLQVHDFGTTDPEPVGHHHDGDIEAPFVPSAPPAGVDTPLASSGTSKTQHYL